MPASPDDPFAALEHLAARQAAEEGARKAVTSARTRLVLGKDAKSVFFATLALRVRLAADWSVPTMAVDGRTLFYNPEFANRLSPDELLGVVAHETMHLALCHHARRMGRDPDRWNAACDLAVNPVLVEAGFALPHTRLMPGEGEYQDLPPGKSAEEYYSRLPRLAGGHVCEEGTETGGRVRGDPGGCGAVRDPGDGSPAAAADQEADWRAAAVAAESMAKSRGTLPAGLARTVDGVLRPPADWRAVLREFVSAHARNDYSWARPNRRYVADGLYLPGLHSEELGEVIIAVDTSGSIGTTQLDSFANEVNGVLSAFDCTATVVYHDSEVQGVEEWRSSDGPQHLNPVGGGGTSHVCVFEWMRSDGKNPACVVCLTDLETEFPPDPGVPVLWAVVGEERRAPFGRVVAIGG
jgi:predicted metal-dependent peptidase